MKRREFLRVGAAAGAAPAVLSFVPHQAGAAPPALAAPPADAPLRLSANENPLGLSPAARWAVHEGMDATNRYAFPYREPLIEALAEKFGVETTGIVLGNGSTELIQMAVQSLLEPGYRIVAAEPTFEDVRRFAGPHEVDFVPVPLASDWSHDLERMEKACLDAPGTALFYVCNPNNPTGSLTPVDDLVRVIERAPERVHFLIDEAYYDYVDHPSYRSLTDLAWENPNVVVIRTFSKVYGMAGMRLGWAVAHPESAARVRDLAPRTNTNHLALAAAMASLGDNAHVQKSLRENRAAKRITMETMDDLGISYLPTHASFIMHEVKGSLNTYRDRMREHGFVVGRDFPPLTQYNRLSFGRPDDMRAFADVLGSFRARGWI